MPVAGRLIVRQHPEGRLSDLDQIAAVLVAAARACEVLRPVPLPDPAHDAVRTLAAAVACVQRLLETEDLMCRAVAALGPVV